MSCAAFATLIISQCAVCTVSDCGGTMRIANGIVTNYAEIAEARMDKIIGAHPDYVYLYASVQYQWQMKPCGLSKPRRALFRFWK